MTTRKPRQRNFMCTVPACESPSYAKGLCKSHYQINRKAQQTVPCSEPGCSLVPVHADGLCRMHYTRKHKPVQFVATCRIENCDANAVTNGCCAKHYAAEYRREKAQRKKAADEWHQITCRIDVCRKPKHKNDLCLTHYNDFRLVRNQGITRNAEAYIQCKNNPTSE